MRIAIYRDEAVQMDDAHGEGLHEETPRDGCPSCSRRELSSYPERPKVKTAYSRAAPFIREQIINTAGLKLSANTQKKHAEYVGQMFGLTQALQIMMTAEDTKSLCIPGRPKFRGDPRAIDEVKRYLGSNHEWVRLGFDEEEAA